MNQVTATGQPIAAQLPGTMEQFLFAQGISRRNFSAVPMGRPAGGWAPAPAVFLLAKGDDSAKALRP